MSRRDATPIDWVGDGVPARLIYEGMADHSFAPVSPSYERLARTVAADPDLLARLDALPAAKQQPNLLLGAVRYLDGPTSDPVQFLTWTHDRWDDVRTVMMTHRTQTNEPRRCSTLLPLLAQLPQPLALIEVGASAGLCLLPDRYAYRYRGPDGVVTVGESAATFDCITTGPVPFPTALPEVVWRRGLDLNPLDVNSDHDIRWLRALIWPEQTERFVAFDAAVDVARQDPPLVVEGNLLADVGSLVHEAPDDATVVVFHSAVLAYLSPAEREPFERSLRGFGRDVVWLSNEAPGIVVEIEGGGHPDRFVVARDRDPHAWSGPHGQSLDWIG